MRPWNGGRRRLSAGWLLGFILISMSGLQGQTQETLVLKVKKALLGDGRSVSDASIVIRNGRIESVTRAAKSPGPLGSRTFEFPGCVATPGFIAANAWMEAFGRIQEERSEVTPEMNLYGSIDPAAPDFEKAWRSGVTCVYLAPGYLNVVGGTGTVLKTAGTSRAERLVKNAVHLRVTLGTEPARGNSKPFYGDIGLRTRRPQNRMGVNAILRGQLMEARNREQVPEADLSVREVLFRRVLRRELPLRIRARSYMDIKTAFRLQEEFGFDWVLEDGTDAYRYLDELRVGGIPVIYGPVYRPKGRADFNPENDRWQARTPVLLAEKGILFAFQNGPSSPIDMLRDDAIFAVRSGLDPRTALKALTSSAAAILGVGDRLGTLAPGKDADILVFDGDPFDPRSRLKKVLVGGHLMDPNE
jgi:imidazolonepropionase-like amidohydrolase